MSAPVEVAVGVLIRPDGRVLMGSRPAGKPYAGYWEFPGGKLEAGETVAQALVRELREELGIAIATPTPWVTIEHRYAHAHVRLHFQRVFAWQGEPRGVEGQELQWCDPTARTADAMPGPLLPATIPCLRWLAVPRQMAISQANDLGVPIFLDRLRLACAQGLRWLQIREPGMPDDRLGRFITEACAITRDYGARISINSGHARPWWDKTGAVHLRAADLAWLSERPALDRVGASVHRRAELQRCADLALDYAVLGSVLPTPTHPDRSALGWEDFSRLVLAPPLPVLAIGGMQASDLDVAATHGAHGIAMLRSAWRSV